MTRAAWKILLALLAALPAAGGCAPCPESLVPLDRLLDDYNANADAIPRLWARVEMSITLDTPESPAYTWRSGSPTCLVLLGKGPQRFGPHDFVLLGRETAAVELFRIGSSVRQGLYYVWYRFGRRGRAWTGRHGSVGVPGSMPLPIDPMQLLSILAVCPLPTEPGQLPAAVVGMQNTPGDCAYVVTVVDRQPVTQRLLLQREIFFRWSDAAPRQPYKINFLDDAGRRILTAHLKRYRPVDVSELDDPPKVPPVMPTDIEIVSNPFGGVEAFVRRIHLVLSEMTAEDKWDRSACDFRPPAGVGLTPVEPPPAPSGDGAAKGNAP